MQVCFEFHIGCIVSKRRRLEWTVVENLWQISNFFSVKLGETPWKNKGRMIEVSIFLPSAYDPTPDTLLVEEAVAQDEKLLRLQSTFKGKVIYAHGSHGWFNKLGRLICFCF